MRLLNLPLQAVALLTLALNVQSFPADQFSGNGNFDSLARRADPLITCLQSGISTLSTFETADHPQFLNDSLRYSIVNSPSYRVIVKAGSEQDIAAAIRCATQTNTKFLATSARHGISTTLSSISNGLEIFTSYLNKITLDTQHNTMTAQGAVTIKQTIEALYAVGKEISTGSCDCVGLIGATLGGGVGRLSGLHGLVLDSLLSVRIMLPNTTIVEASQSKNSELFWGIRGAGFNFGIVLNATYRIYDAVPQGLHLNADMKFPLSQAGSYFRNLEAALPLPAPLSIINTFYFDPISNQTVILANAVYAGREAAGRRAIQFLLDQRPFQTNITMVPWNKLIAASGFGPTPAAICSYGNRESVWGAGVKRIDPPTYVRLARLFEEMITRYPQTIFSSVQIQVLPLQAVQAVPVDATAFPWRKHVSHNFLSFVYTDAITTDEITGYPRRMRDVMVPTAGTKGLQVYVSYSHGDETVEQLYSKKKLPRLAALKKRIDPSGLFNGYHPVPTAYP